MPSNHEKLVERNKASTLASWTAQNAWSPLTMDRAEGVYFWDADGNRYLDWSSQLFNVNIGHGNQRVIQAIQDQAAKITYAYPGIATEPRAALAEKLQAITPEGLTKAFFTLGGADAVESAMKMARMVTGRQKVLSRYRSYHGATFGAMTAGGDPRRLANEPGVPWIVHVHDPYAYRSPIYRGRTAEQGDQIVADLIEETVMIEGPENVAAILLEGYSGSSGILQGGEAFWAKVQQICDQHGILLIVDEVLSGFGRTGEWFGVGHYPAVQPDIMVMAKGLTSGYVPMGAAMVSGAIAEHFDDKPLVTGLTYSSHALACAAGLANLEVMEQDDLVERSKTMGVKLRAGLMELAEEHPCVGDVRGVGLHQVLELVSDRDTRAPMSEFNQPLTEPMQKVAATLRQHGISTFVRFNWIFCAPPLIISDEELQEGLQAIDAALAEADAYYKG